MYLKAGFGNEACGVAFSMSGIMAYPLSFSRGERPEFKLDVDSKQWDREKGNKKLKINPLTTTLEWGSS